MHAHVRPATVEHIGELLFSASKKIDGRWLIRLFLPECVSYGHSTDHERSTKVLMPSLLVVAFGGIADYLVVLGRIKVNNVRSHYGRNW